MSNSSRKLELFFQAYIRNLPLQMKLSHSLLVDAELRGAQALPLNLMFFAKRKLSAFPEEEGTSFTRVPSWSLRAGQHDENGYVPVSGKPDQIVSLSVASRRFSYKAINQKSSPVKFNRSRCKLSLT